jgi:hypothetical protein
MSGIVHGGYAGGVVTATVAFTLLCMAAHNIRATIKQPGEHNLPRSAMEVVAAAFIPTSMAALLVWSIWHHR